MEKERTVLGASEAEEDKGVVGTTNGGVGGLARQPDPTGTRGQDHQAGGDRPSRTNMGGCGPGDRKHTDRKPSKPENSHIEGVMFVPHTPGGALAKCIRREDDKFASLT